MKIIKVLLLLTGLFLSGLPVQQVFACHKDDDVRSCNNQLHIAARDGDADGVRAAIRNGADIHAFDYESGENALHIATWCAVSFERYPFPRSRISHKTFFQNLSERPGYF